MIGEMQSRLEAWRGDNPTYAVASGTEGFGAYPAGEYYDITLTDASATGYTLTATGKGKQASDAQCSKYVLVQSGSSETKTPAPDDSECW